MIADQADQPIAEPRVWVVVVSKPGQEQRAKRELENQDFEVYLPMRLFENKQGGMSATPFLRGYLFARVPVNVAAWRSIFSTYGVSGVLGWSTTGAYGLKDKFVEEIKAREEGGYIKLGLPEDAAPASFGSGQRVVIDGVIPAMFSCRLDAHRALILVSAFGRDSVHKVDIKRLAAQAAI